jgi:hypothetical protein
MDLVTTMALTGALDNDKKEARGNMTDLQFKGMVKLCLTIAESTKDVKEFRKMLQFPDQGFGSGFVHLLINMAHSTNNMDRVRKVLKDIMMMEGEM